MDDTDTDDMQLIMRRVAREFGGIKELLHEYDLLVYQCQIAKSHIWNKDKAVVGEDGKLSIQRAGNLGQVKRILDGITRRAGRQDLSRPEDELCHNCPVGMLLARRRMEEEEAARAARSGKKRPLRRRAHA